MTQPTTKPNASPRPRAPSAGDRLVLTPTGRALLTNHEQLRALPTFNQALNKTFHPRR